MGVSEAPPLHSKALRGPEKRFINHVFLIDNECPERELAVRSPVTTGPYPQSFSVRLTDDSQVTGTPTFSPVASPHKGLPPRPPSHNRPPPPQSLDGLRHLHYTRMDYDKSPIKPKMWSESSLDEPYEKVKKRSSHGR